MNFLPHFYQKRSLTPFLAPEETIEIVTLFRMTDKAVYLFEHEIDEDLGTRATGWILQVPMKMRLPPK